MTLAISPLLHLGHLMLSWILISSLNTDESDYHP